MLEAPVWTKTSTEAFNWLSHLDILENDDENKNC